MTWHALAREQMHSTRCKVSSLIYGAAIQRTACHRVPEHTGEETGAAMTTTHDATARNDGGIVHKSLSLLELKGWYGGARSSGLSEVSPSGFELVAMSTKGDANAK